MAGTEQNVEGAFIQTSASWSQDREQKLHSSEQVAWIVAAIAAVIALIEAGAFIILAPSKTSVPELVTIDRQTGFVQHLDPLAPGKISPDMALTQSFLAQYVVARESFGIHQLQSNFRKVSIWSAGDARANYVSAVQASNPSSPLARYSRQTIIDTRIKSVAQLSSDTALVRFETSARDTTGPQAPTAWIAAVKFRFVATPLPVGDRHINPLGFQVVQYRRDLEALPDESPPQPSTVATTSVTSQAHMESPEPSTPSPPDKPRRSPPVQQTQPTPKLPDGVELTL